MKPLREVLEEAYLDLINNYENVDEYAEKNNISKAMATEVLFCGSKIHNENSVETNNLDDFS